MRSVKVALAVLATLATGVANAHASSWSLEHVQRLHAYSDLQELIALGPQDGWAIDGNARLLRRGPSGWRRARGIAPQLLEVGTDGAPWAFGTTRRSLRSWRFDGADWVDHPDMAPETFLLAAAPIADTDIWVAGARAASGRHRVRHWDGSSWRTNRTPLPIGGLAAVAAGDLWATADQSSGKPAQPAIMHWNGAAWARVPVPRIALPKPIRTRLDGRTLLHRPTAQINDIAAASATDVWAVGNVITRLCCDDRVYGREIVLHWDGNAWRRVSLNQRSAELRAVAVDPVGGVWIAANLFGRGRRPQLLNFRGGRWARVNLPRRPRERDVGIKAIAAVPGTTAVWTFAQNGLRTPVGRQDNEDLIYRYSR